MSKELQGWFDLESVYIPPVKKTGFRGNVIIRKPVEAFGSNTEECDENRDEVYDEEATVLLKTEEVEYDGEEPTVLITPDIKIMACIRRIKTDEETEITKNEFIIGKSKEADLVVKDNPTISRRHAKICCNEEGYWLEDLNSANHTYIENRQIDEAVKLKNKMQFCLSKDEKFEFIIRMEN